MVKRSDEKVIKLCEQKQCTGCAACFSVCPTNSISMQENIYSEIHPVLNTDTCIQCGLCQDVCPQIKDISFKECIKCFAGWRNDEYKRRDSSSGGIAALLYEKFLDAGYVCYGVKYNLTKGAYYTLITSTEDIDQIKGSKYVQADVGEVFKEIGRKLKENKKILFIGTPCQVAGLENLISVKYKKFRKNITLIDFLCHGTVPGKYLLNEIHNIENKKKFCVDGISFRSNIPKINYYFSLYYNNKLRYSRKAELQPYFYGFLHSTFCRESCVECLYKCEKRVGDVTLGDFIGLGGMDPIKIPYGINPSLVFINSKQGEKAIKLIQDESVLIERKAAEAISGGPSFKQKNVDSNMRRRFRKLYISGGYDYAKKRTINRKMIIDFYFAKLFSYTKRVIRKVIKIMKRGKR